MDSQAFESFYEKTSRLLWAYLHRVSGDAALAEDILQEAYYRFLRSRIAISDEKQMKAYLYKIATNLLKDYWRKQNRQRDRSKASRSEEYLTQDETRGFDVAQAFAKLSMQERSLLWLAYVEGNDHREIAAALGLREKSVRVLLFRARKKLSLLLGHPDSVVS